MYNLVLDLLVKIWSKWLIIDELLISLIDWFSKYKISKIYNVFLKVKYATDVFFEENIVFLWIDKEVFVW